MAIENMDTNEDVYKKKKKGGRRFDSNNDKNLELYWNNVHFKEMIQLH